MSDYITSNIKGIFIDNQVKRSPITNNVSKNAGSIPIIYGDFSSLDDRELKKGYVYLVKYKGRFFKKCPGTKFYNCCGYKIIHIGEGCPLNCSYCILKAYFSHNSIKVWANIEDLYMELDKVFSNREKFFRVGTGEFTDSLAIEYLTNYSKYLIEFLSQFKNVILELKTKVVDLSWIDAVKDPRLVLPAWSLNGIDVPLKEEMSTAPLEERLKAAKICAEMGFRVCLHFDPIIYYPGWERGYKETIEMIFDYIKPKDIAYLSLGSFRGMPYLFKFIEENWPDSDYIYFGEFIKGIDGKLRLFRPIRIKQFRFMVNLLRKYGVDKQIYFCMESDEVWRACLGYTPKDIGGLANHLIQLSFAPFQSTN